MDILLFNHSTSPTLMTTQPAVAGVWAGPRSLIIQTQNIPSREPAVAYLFTANISPKKQEPQSPRSIKYIIVYILIGRG